MLNKILPNLRSFAMDARAMGLSLWGRFFGRVRTPQMLQLEAVECGAVCLRILLAHYGYWASMQEVRKACAVTRDGSSAADIVRGARDYGLKVRGWRKEPSQLLSMPLPAVLFWEFKHWELYT